MQAKIETTLASKDAGRAVLALVIFLAMPVACGPTEDGDGGASDGGVRDDGGGTGEDGGDGGEDGGDAGHDGGGTGEDGGDAGEDGGEATALPLCVEAENLIAEGDVTLWPSVPSTERGVVIAEQDAAGRFHLDFVLSEAQELAVWVRVRAVTHSSNSLFVGLDGLEAEPEDSAIRDASITPVLRWQRVRLRGGTGTSWRADSPDWPGTVSAGAHRLTMAGREPALELDAVCVTSPDHVPEPRLPTAPDRAVVANASDFGAVGDGVADDTAALQDAIDSLAEGEALVVEAGRYRLTNELIIPTNGITVEGELDEDGERLTTLYLDLPATGVYAGFRIQGSAEGSATPLLEDAQMLDRSVLVASGGAFAVGDPVVVRSDDWGPPNADLVAIPKPPVETYRHRRNDARIVHIWEEEGGSRLVLDRPLLSPFALEHGATVSLLHPREGVVVRRLRIEGTEHHLDGVTDDEWTAEERARNANARFIRARFVADCFFQEMELFHFRPVAISIEESMDSYAYDNWVHDSTDWDGGGRGYGISLNASQGSVARGNRLTGVMRHSVILNWGARECFLFENVIERAVEPHPEKWASVDVHGQDAYGNLIEANEISGGGSIGVILGGGGGSHGNDGPWNVVRGNTIRDVDHTGIMIDDHTHDQVIEGNHIIDSARYAVSVLYGSERTYVWNNRIEGWGSSGIRVLDSADTQIVGNVLRGDDPVIDIAGDSTAYQVSDNDVDGGRIDHPGTGVVE